MDKELYRMACQASSAEALAMHWNLAVERVRPKTPTAALALAREIAGDAYGVALDATGMPQFMDGDRVVVRVWDTGTAIAV